MRYSIQNKPIIVGNNAKVWPFNLIKVEGDFSIAVVKVGKNGHGATMNTICDRAYYIIKGVGKFRIATETILVDAGQLVCVPKNTIYDFWASEEDELELLLIQVPTFVPEAEVSV